ncbi:carbon starvation protein A [bacterium]|nr:carbon starvation protein A [bacterium]
MLPGLPLSPVLMWTVILLIYAAIASVLPVWRLLQPRDYINGHQLLVAMGLLGIGIVVARPEMVAPAFDPHPSVDAPPLWPMLFVTIACGAISGFHCLVSSGTTSKQMDRESHALRIGYGGMLLEGMLAVLVIVAVGAGIGLATDGAGLSGVAKWHAHYASWRAADGLAPKVGGFVDGSANMLAAFGIPLQVGVAIMGVFVAAFAATTLDTACRLQRYVVAELASAMGIKPLTNKYDATAVAVVLAAVLAFPNGGKGGLILWPLFGATNQLLGCLALLVMTVYLKRRGKPIVVTLIPMLFMLVMTAWAMTYNLREFYRMDPPQWHLVCIGVVIMALEIWMVVESFVVMAGIRSFPARFEGAKA